jgi:hypothetical protein
MDESTEDFSEEPPGYVLPTGVEVPGRPDFFFRLLEQSQTLSIECFRIT